MESTTYLIPPESDPMGRAIADYHSTGKAKRLIVTSTMFDDDEMPVEVLFRGFDKMPAIEQEALRLAEEENLDLVKISPNAVPPVCKIMDWGKFKFEQAKKEKEEAKLREKIMQEIRDKK